MNENVQKLMFSEFSITTFNTSNNKQREDLYSRKGIKEVMRMFRTWFDCFLFLRSGKSNLINIFIVSNLAFCRDFFLILMAKFLKKKVIVHLHSKKNGELFLGNFTIKFLALVLNLADKVYVLSKDHKAFFSKYIKDEVLDVLENFVFIDDYFIAKKREDLQFLYVGRLTEQKGFYELLAAVKNLSKQGYAIILNVAGAAATDADEKIIRAYVSDNNIGRHINFLGLVSCVKKKDAFHRSAVLVFPSRFENSPIVLKEALAAKQIIVCSDLEANKNVLDNFNGLGETVFSFKVSSVEDLTNKMKILLDNPSETLMRSENVTCRAEATDQYAFMKLKKDFYDLV